MKTLGALSLAGVFWAILITMVQCYKNLVI